MKLREYLEKKNLNIHTFAVMSDVHNTSICRVIAGLTPSLQTAVKIVEATKGEVDYKDLL